MAANRLIDKKQNKNRSYFFVYCELKKAIDLLKVDSLFEIN